MLQKLKADRAVRKLDAMRARVFRKLEIRKRVQEFPALHHAELGYWEEQAARDAEDAAKAKAAGTSQAEVKDSLDLSVIEAEPLKCQSVLKATFVAGSDGTSVYGKGREDRHARSHFVNGVEMLEVIDEQPALVTHQDKNFVETLFEETFGVTLAAARQDPGLAACEVSDGSSGWAAFRKRWQKFDEAKKKRLREEAKKKSAEEVKKRANGKAQKRRQRGQLQVHRGAPYNVSVLFRSVT